jgi:hypothetical protein
LERRRRGIGW